MSGILRKVSSSILTVAKPSIVQKATVISGPPKYRVPMQEKVALGLVMIGATVAPIAWVLTHVKYYRERD